MLNTLTRRLMAATLALAAGTVSTAASAETRELFYGVWRMGISLDYGGMGYNDEEGSFINLAGNHIVGARVVLDFTPNAGVDISTLHMAMVVPVLGSNSEYFAVQASDLQQVSPGHYMLDLSSSDYNGEIRMGRFSIEAYGLDLDGNPINLPGLVGETTGYYFTVDVPPPVPEPASAWLLMAGLGLATQVARKRAAA